MTAGTGCSPVPPTGLAVSCTPRFLEKRSSIAESSKLKRPLALLSGTAGALNAATGAGPLAGTAAGNPPDEPGAPQPCAGGPPDAVATFLDMTGTILGCVFDGMANGLGGAAGAVGGEPGEGGAPKGWAEAAGANGCVAGSGGANGTGGGAPKGCTGTACGGAGAANGAGGGAPKGCGAGAGSGAGAANGIGAGAGTANCGCSGI